MAKRPPWRNFLEMLFGLDVAKNSLLIMPKKFHGLVLVLEAEVVEKSQILRIKKWKENKSPSVLLGTLKYRSLTFLSFGKTAKLRSLYQNNQKWSPELRMPTLEKNLNHVVK